MEIYEGVVVKQHQFLFDGSEYEKEIIGAIKYNAETMAFHLSNIKNVEVNKHMGYAENETPSSVPICLFYGLHEESWEVIGNIHDNPELMEVQTDE